MGQVSDICHVEDIVELIRKLNLNTALWYTTECDRKLIDWFTNWLLYCDTHLATWYTAKCGCTYSMCSCTGTRLHRRHMVLTRIQYSCRMRRNELRFYTPSISAQLCLVQETWNIYHLTSKVCSKPMSGTSISFTERIKKIQNHSDLQKHVTKNSVYK